MKRKWIAIAISIALLGGLFGVLPAPRVLAATTYTWNQTGSGSWAVASNWTPARNTPAIDDILIIDGSATGSPTLTNIPTQTIGQLKLIGNANAAFMAAAPTTLTIAGGAGTDFDIGSGSSLTLSGSSAIQLALSASTTGSIGGSMTVAGGAHRLTAMDAVGITLNSGAYFTTSTGFTGNAFGTGTANSVVFASGSTYTHNAGSNPFALTAPSSVVVFQPGSTAVYRTSGGYAASGRTFANLTVQNNTALSGSGSADFQFQTLTVDSGSSFMHTGSGTATVTIKGGISSAGSSTVTIASGSGGIQVNGGTDQVFGGGGGSGAITFGGALTVASGTTVAAARTLIANGATTINGSFQLNSGGWATGTGTWIYGPGATLIFNGSGSYGVNNADVYWPTASGPTNVTVQGGGLTMNSGAIRSVSGAFQTSAGVTHADNLILDGTAQINSGGYFASPPVYGATSSLVYNPGGSHTISHEWISGGTVGSGVPKNVTIQNSTAVALGNGAGSRTVGGTLAIGSGSSLSLGATIGDDLYVGGNWTNNGTFTHNNGAVHFNGTGTQTIGGSQPTSFFDIFIDAFGRTSEAGVGSPPYGPALAGATVVLETQPTVEGAVTNNGTPLQTQTVDNATVNFLNLKNSAATVDKYFGVRITSTNNLGSTAVSVSGNQVCSQANGYPVKRCFVVDPANTAASDLTFYYSQGEMQTGQAATNLKAWKYNGSSWSLAGSSTTASSCASGQPDCSVTVTGVSAYGPPIEGVDASTGPFALKESSPQAVTLIDFTVEQQGDAILVTWETASELDTRGFNLYRGTSATGPDRQLNETLIPSQSPGNPGGFVYTWADRAELVSGSTYYYWVEDVSLTGATTMHGPVSADYTVPTAVTVAGFQTGSAAGAAVPLAVALFALLTPLAGGLAASRRRRL